MGPTRAMKKRLKQKIVNLGKAQVGDTSCVQGYAIYLDLGRMLEILTDMTGKVLSVNLNDEWQKRLSKKISNAFRAALNLDKAPKHFDIENILKHRTTPRIIKKERKPHDGLYYDLGIICGESNQAIPEYAGLYDEIFGDYVTYLKNAGLIDMSKNPTLAQVQQKHVPQVDYRNRINVINREVSENE